VGQLHHGRLLLGAAAVDRRRTLGGFVLFRDNAATLPRALQGLLATCDEVLAVDTGSTDGSAGLVEAAGVRRLQVPWRGFGAARAAAARALAHHDALFFLDSDEWLPGPSVAALRGMRAWPEWPEAVALRRRDWVTAGQARFVLRSEWRKRVVLTPQASWTDAQFVHESLPGSLRTRRLDAVIEHDFLPSLESRAVRNDRYGLLWALREQAARGGPVTVPWTKRPWLQQWAHFLRNAVLKGAALRGGVAGVSASWLVARYHADKYRWLERLAAGEEPGLQAAVAAGDYAAVFSATGRR
jgi:glycosyltransferase involved in cell wall biosynthesis